MKLAVVSMIHEAWGGSEELWAAAAENALNNKDSVIHSALIDGSNHPKIKKLLKQGMQQHIRFQYVPDQKPLIVRAIIKRFFLLKEIFINRFNSLIPTKADTILYVGTAYSIANDFDLISVSQKMNATLLINCQLNFEQPVGLSQKQKQKIISAFGTAEKIFFVSERNMQVAFKELGRSFTNATVIRNPVNMVSFEMLPFPENNTIQMAMVGNLLCVHKGQDIVIRLLGSEEWKHKAWQLNIYGSGPDEKMLKDLVHSLNLENKIIFHGKVADIRRLWTDNHILLMPSHMEGMPLAVVEAMLCGRPVVATDVGGHSEWIENGKEGFIASKANEISFGAALSAAWQKKSDWEQIGNAAHKKAIKLTDTDAGMTFYNILKIVAAGKE